MRVVVTSEARFERTPDGAVWTAGGPAHQFWTRYLSAFDAVTVLARVRDTPAAPATADRVDGPEVDVWPVPYYVGPRQYLRQWIAVGRAVRGAAARATGDAVIVRAPSPLGHLLATARDRHGLPYALEVVGDPYDVLASGVVSHPLRPLLRHLGGGALRRRCRGAVAVAYVTEAALQYRYPAGPGAATAVYSSLELAPDAIVAGPRMPAPGRPPSRLLSVGSLEQLYKGVDTLLHGLARSGDRAGAPLHLTHLGDGRYRPHLERLAAQLGVGSRVTFAGAVPAGAVRQHLDAADLFVLPSRTEGLPRALVEAMARALPAVATRVGGTPELLAAEYLVAPDDPTALADAIARLLDDPARMAAASAANLARARRYAAEFLTPRRDAFYRALRETTGELMGTARRSPAGVR